jgi:hypothetical protein
VKHRAAILSYSYSKQAPTAKELAAFLGKSSKLLYGNDKRVTKNTPYTDKIHLIDVSFREFRHLFTASESIQNYKLYIFDHRIRSSHFLLRYGQDCFAQFELDNSIIDEMYHLQWAYSHLKSHRKSLITLRNSLDFYTENNVGDKSFQEKFDLHRNAIDSLVDDTNKALKVCESRSFDLFQSRWSN